MSKIKRPCLNCGALSTNGTRCPTCAPLHDKLYGGNYRKRAEEVRATAVTCWLCGEGARLDDPWTADHVLPGNPQSELRPAHRSCNSSRGNKR